MRLAIAEAERALAHDDVPVGAVVAGPGGDVIGAGHNERELPPGPERPRRDDRAARGRRALGSWRLLDTVALRHARALRDVRGRDRPRPHPARRLRHADPKAGAAGSVLDILAEPRLNHRPAVTGGVLAARVRGAAGRLLRRPPALIATLTASPRRGARVVESGGLENRCVGNPCTEGSNPSPSASRRDSAM